MGTRQLEPLLRYLRRAATGDAATSLPDAELLARFTAGRDEAAFTALVRRHGPLVLGVCRRVLRDPHAAEDAFQATFLVLARKAGSIARPEVLGHWLHGVACRTAARARADAARRRAHERRAPGRMAVDPNDELLWRDLRPVLDEEVNRLPPRYRVPFVLCYLEGRTNAEAARQIGCSRGTIATLLARARERLRRRLTGRGLALPAGLTALTLAESGGASAALELSTVQAAVAFAAGSLHTTAASARAALLAEGVAKAMLMKKGKLAVAVLLMAGLVGAGGGTIAYRAAAQGTEPPAEGQTPPPVVPQPVAVPAIPVTAPSKEASARSNNFTVTAPTPEIAEKIGRAAERHRKALALRWLGRELADWPKPCVVHVKITAQGSGGATSFSMSSADLVDMQMSLEGPLDAILADCLPHEVTHTILIHWLGRSVPRWADEGVAISSESIASRDKHRRMLWTILDEGRRLPLRRLLELREFPQDVMVLYVQGYSLTEFLVGSGGRSQFLKFVAEGDRDGWQEAAREHYGYDTLEDLEKAWLRHVRQDRQKEMDNRAAEARPAVPPLAPAYEPKDSVRVSRRPRGRLPDGPPPTQALVALDKDGRLLMWSQNMSYSAARYEYPGRQPFTTYIPVYRMTATRHDLDAVQVYDTKGKTVDPKDLSRLLKGEIPALVSADGRPVDPLHLRLVKEGTLVFVLPLPTPADAADAAPPATRPILPPAVVAPPPPAEGAVPIRPPTTVPAPAAPIDPYASSPAAIPAPAPPAPPVDPPSLRRPAASKTAPRNP